MERLTSHHHQPETAITSKRNINNEDIYRMSRAAAILDNADLLALYAAEANEPLTSTRRRFLNLIHAAPPSVAPSGSGATGAQTQRDAVSRGIEFPIQWAPTTGSPTTGTRAGPLIHLLVKQESDVANLPTTASLSTPARVQQESPRTQQAHSRKKKRSLPDESERRSGTAAAAASSSGGDGNGSGKSPLYRSRVAVSQQQQQEPRHSSNSRRKRKSTLTDSP